MTRPRYRPWLRMPRTGRRAPAVRRSRGLLLSALLGVGLALLVIAALDNALRPVVTTLAQAKTENVVTGIINDAVTETLSAEAVAYQDLVTLERDSSGQVALLSTNSAKMNALRTQILQTVLEKVDSLDSRDLGIPLGSITGLIYSLRLGTGSAGAGVGRCHTNSRVPECVYLRGDQPDPASGHAGRAGRDRPSHPWWKDRDSGQR